MAKTGLNNAMVRVENRKKLTNLLYEESGITKQELARRLQLSAPTVNLLIQQLEDDNLIFYQSSEKSSGGRIPNLVCFKYHAYITAGVEVQKKRYRILLIDLKYQILDETTVEKAFEPSAAYWENMRSSIDELLKKNNILPSSFLGIGVSVPGPVDQKSKTFSSMLLTLPQYSYEEAERIMGCPLVLENDANSAGFAEIWASDELDNAAYLSVSKGVGGALIHHREVMRGHNSLSGEFGHMIIVPNGKKCLCGRRGCLDMYCSTNVLSQYTEDSLQSFFEKKPESEALQKHWKQYLDHLIIGVTNLSIMLDYPVIIGGEIVPFLQDEFDEFSKRVESMDVFKRNTPICRLSTMGVNGSAIGAALMVIHKVLDI